MLKQKYFLTDFFILSAEKQLIKSSWRKIEWLLYCKTLNINKKCYFCNSNKAFLLLERISFNVDKSSYNDIRRIFRMC